MSSARPRRVRLLLAAAALSSLALAACSGGSGSAGGSASPNAAGVTLLKPGKLLVCTHLSYKPFQFKDDSGNVVGFDVDVMDLVAKKLGVQQEIVDIDFASMTSGAVFAAKKCDAAAGAVTITDKRAETVLFSDPYFKATQALLVKKDSGIKDLPDLKGKKLGVQTDTTGQIFADKNKDTDGYTVVVFDDLPTQAAGVLAGRVDAAINDNGALFAYAKDNQTTEVVKEFDTGEQYGIMFQKNNANGTALAKVTNEVLATAKTDGSYNTIYKKWFGVDAPN